MHKERAKKNEKALLTLESCACVSKVLPWDSAGHHRWFATGHEGD